MFKRLWQRIKTRFRPTLSVNLPKWFNDGRVYLDANSLAQYSWLDVLIIANRALKFNPQIAIYIQAWLQHHQEPIRSRYAEEYAKLPKAKQYLYLALQERLQLKLGQYFLSQLNLSQADSLLFQQTLTYLQQVSEPDMPYYSQAQFELGNLARYFYSELSQADELSAPDKINLADSYTFMQRAFYASASAGDIGAFKLLHENMLSTVERFIGSRPPIPLAYVLHKALERSIRKPNPRLYIHPTLYEFVETLCTGDNFMTDVIDNISLASGAIEIRISPFLTAIEQKLVAYEQQYGKYKHSYGKRHPNICHSIDTAVNALQEVIHRAKTQTGSDIEVLLQLKAMLESSFNGRTALKIFDTFGFDTFKKEMVSYLKSVDFTSDHFNKGITHAEHQQRLAQLKAHYESQAPFRAVLDEKDRLAQEKDALQKRLDQERNLMMQQINNLLAELPTLRKEVDELKNKNTVLEQKVTDLETKQQTLQIPERFYCPLSHEIMRKPVLIKGDIEQHAFEYDELKQWLAGHYTHPITQAVLPQPVSIIFYPGLRRDIENFIERANPELLSHEQREDYNSYLQVKNEQSAAQRGIFKSSSASENMGGASSAAMSISSSAYPS